MAEVNLADLTPERLDSLVEAGKPFAILVNHTERRAVEAILDLYLTLYANRIGAYHFLEVLWVALCNGRAIISAFLSHPKALLLRRPFTALPIHLHSIQGYKFSYVNEQNSLVSIEVGAR